MWKTKKAKLTVHFEEGFSLREEPDSPDAEGTLLWAHPFEDLRSSSDDGHGLLWLDFAGHGEQVNTK